MKENCERIIEFIKDTMELEEGEEFFAQEFRLYHPWYTLFGENFYIGSIVVICNKPYMDMIRRCRLDLLGPEKQSNDSPVLRFNGYARHFIVNDEAMKFLIIRCIPSDYYAEDRNLFKGVLEAKNVKKRFPYLDGVVDSLNLLTVGEINDTDNLIEKFSSIVESNKEKFKQKVKGPVSKK